MEHSGMLQEAENLVNIGHFEEAFDKFMALESGTFGATYLRPCQLALANQLKKHNSLNYPKLRKKRFVEIIIKAINLSKASSKWPILTRFSAS